MAVQRQRAVLEETMRAARERLLEKTAEKEVWDQLPLYDTYILSAARKFSSLTLRTSYRPRSIYLSIYLVTDHLDPYLPLRDAAHDLYRTDPTEETYPTVCHAEYRDPIGQHELQIIQIRSPSALNYL